MVFLPKKGLRMDRCPKQWIAMALAHTFTVLACTAIVSGQNGGLRGFEEQLKELHQALDEAQLANKAVRMELDEARDTHYNESWMTEERAASMMSLVQDVLADSNQRVNLYGDGTMMGWNDGFYLGSSDGQFRLNVGGLMQTQFMATWEGVNAANSTTYDEWRAGFGMSKTALNFNGHAFGKGLTYNFELGWGMVGPYNWTSQNTFMGARLWDAWVAFQLTNETKIKIGQFEIPFTKESLVQSQYQMAVYRSLVDYLMGLERNTGAQLEWQTDDRRFVLAVTNGSPALFNGFFWGHDQDPSPPWPALSQDTLYSVSMRHEWKLLGDWGQFEQYTSPPGSERGVVVGLAGHRQNNESTNPLPVGGFADGTFWGITTDIMMQFDGASLFGAIIYERVRDVSPTLPTLNLLAYVVQGSTYITNQTELFVRFEGGGPDSELAGGDKLQVLTLGMNHYVDGQDLKFTADFGFSFGEISAQMANTEAGWNIDARRRNQAMLRTQLQLMF